MSDNLKLFKWLALASIALAAAAVLAHDHSRDMILGLVVVVPIPVVLIWLTAKGYRWMIIGVVAWFVWLALITLGEIWTAGPDWLGQLFDDETNIYERIAFVISVILLGAALAIYFFKPAKAHQLPA
jgi:hypothetical protein